MTVVTPTVPWRHDKLLEACRSVREQTLRDWVHLIVPDGPDPEVQQILLRAGHCARVLPLGRRHGVPGHWSRLLGGLVATTPYIAYLDDDNTWRPRHLEVLLRELEDHPDAGFAYSQLAHPDGSVLGDGLIAPGRAVNHIDTSMVAHRAELLVEIATWDPHMVGIENSYALDGVLVDLWLRAGVSFRFVPEVTVNYLQYGHFVDAERPRELGRV